MLRRAIFYAHMRFRITKPFLGTSLDFQIILLGFFRRQCFIAESFPTLPYGAPVRRHGARAFCGSGQPAPRSTRQVWPPCPCLPCQTARRPRPAGPSFVRRVALVQPLVQRLARGISQLARRAPRITGRCRLPPSRQRPQAPAAFSASYTCISRSGEMQATLLGRPGIDGHGHSHS